MNLDGGGQQELTQFTAAVRDECMDATWSTDGNTIVFWSELEGTPDIYVIGADGAGCAG